MNTDIKAFSLIELLIVISIIAILAVVGTVVYSGIQANSRDQDRLRDLVAIKQALELYRSDAHLYPSSLNFGQPLTRGSVTYLDIIPQDKKSDRIYAYKAYADTTGGADCDNSATPCTTYVLCARKEGSTNNSCPVANLNCGQNGLCDIGVNE